jgi:glycosyltransferase involved in cell wall biosynthesis
MDKPLVSIVTITYNHEPWIPMAIEGVLMQKVSFPIEYIIAEDCSTDGTRKICEQYAQKYPDIIKLLPSDKNYGAVENEHRAFVAAKGKYIATCEGDDYWTDPLKLQKQVDFLEAHSDYSVTFHRYKKYFKETDEYKSDGMEFLFSGKNIYGVDVTTEMFIDKWITQFLTMVFKRESIDLDISSRYKYYRDSHLTYHLLQNGKCFLFSFVGGVYNITGNGIYSSIKDFQLSEKWIAVNEELWRKNDDIRLLQPYLKSMQDTIDLYIKDEKHKKNVLKYIFRHLMSSYDIIRFLKNIKHFLF